VAEPPAPALLKSSPDIGGRNEPVRARVALPPRQDPPCLFGIRTVRTFRPFFRRRDSTARPHRVDIRARKPWVLIRRLLRGRYVGCITPPMSPISYLDQPETVKVDFSTRKP
jgi:hypothetical protein